MAVHLEETEQITNSPEILLSKSLTLLKIQANQNDLLIFQSFFCAECQEFILANGLFPPPAQHNPAHALAWLPAVDEPRPGQPWQVIQEWLPAAPINEERRSQLTGIAPTSNSMCWALILDPEEREEWFDFLADYLDQLADSWLMALNGFDTGYFRADEIWIRPRPARHFGWLSEPEEVNEQ